MNPLIQALQSLLEQQSIAYSKWPKREIQFLERQLMLGSLTVQQLPTGRRVSIAEREQFMNEITRRFPNFGNKQTPRTRHEAVLAVRDAHQSTITYPSLGVRVLRNSGEISFKGEEIKMISNSMSYLSIVEKELSSWSVSGRIVLIENLEPFLHADIVHAEYDFAVYYAGTISSDVVAWISTQNVEILMAPDYDPVGLSQFEKVRSVAKTQLWVPDDIAEVFESHHNKDSLHKQNNRTILLSLLGKTGLDKATLKIVELINRYQGCLYQEIFYPVEAESHT